jgi:ABC-type branched-subunit amino acid transport system ATPase component
MRIDWVRLENFHGFKDQTIPLNESFTVLVGDNRSGKTAVRDGLVERQPDPNDGRVVQVHITALGANVIDSRRLDRMTKLSKFIEGLTLEEKRAIASAIPALRRLVELGTDS